MSQAHVPQTSVRGTESQISDEANESPDDHYVKRTMSSNGDSSSCTDSDDNFGIKFEDWGFQVDRLFEVAYRFYKRNESKAFHPSFDERNQLIALILQAKYGNFDSGRAPDVGALDLVGKSRRQYWATLKGMSRTEAMSKFISTLNDLCPLLKAHVEAVRISCNNPSTVEASKAIDGQIPSESTSVRKNEKLQAIYTSLCRQTYQQFKGYAIKQYPNDVQQQKYLISSLQEQYYQQYISQMHPEFSNSSSREQLKSSLSPVASETSISHEDNGDSSKSLNEISDDLKTVNIVSSNHDDSNDKSCNPMQTISQSIASAEDVSLDDRYVKNPSIENSACYLKPDSDDSTTKRSAEQVTEQYSHGGVHENIPRTTNILDSSLPKPNPYQPTDLQSIGKFEAFPKPRPIPNIAHVTTRPIDVQTVARDNRKASRPEFTAIDLSGELLNKEEPYKMPSTLPPEKLPPQPMQELPPPPSESPTPVLASEEPLLPSSVHPLQTENETYISNNCNNQANHNQESCSAAISETKPSKELWDCDDSSSGNDVESPIEHSIPCEPATTWTKRGVTEFKESLSGDNNVQEGAYVVKLGTLVTIQVPTHPDGKYIYWEFATEDYDIGFGLDFVYENNPDNPLEYRILEETDEDDEEDYAEMDGALINEMSGDAEAAAPVNGGKIIDSFKQKRAEKFARLANTISIIPTYRRDSHEEIFVGKHKYPGRGHYLLKFDNTYSVLRSKTVFFRICCFI